jgi:hypothetical protein
LGAIAAVPRGRAGAERRDLRVAMAAILLERRL